ncbi:MAG: hypothetical protein IKF42_03750 [Mogibacterium sp.]|nr:hypothetical protein [Mogibacterium sp.]
MEIETIYMRAEYTSRFDDSVNACISKGWKLTRREILKSNTPELCSMLYAELVKEDEENQIKLSPQAIEAIERTRGTLSASDYANAAILVGIQRMEFMKGMIGRIEEDPAEEE